MKNFLQKNAQFALNISIAIYVPSTANISEAVNNSAQVERIFLKMSEKFGGCTVSNAIGGWVSPTAGLVKEPVTICKSYMSAEAANSVEIQGFIMALVANLKISMSQDAIGVEFDNQMYFI